MEDLLLFAGVNFFMLLALFLVTSREFRDIKKGFMEVPPPSEQDRKAL